MSQMGADSRQKLATAGNKAVSHLSQLDGQELILPEMAQVAKSWGQTLNVTHDWTGREQGRDNGVVINIALMGLAPDMPIAEP